MSGTDPNDPFRNPGWGGQAAYPPEPPAVPPPWAPMPTPTPAPPKKAVWPIVVAVVAGFGAMLGLLGFVASRDDDGGRDETVAAEPDDEADTTTSSSTSTSSTTSTTTSTSTSTTTTAPAPDATDLPDPGGPVVSSGAMSLQLPAGWVGADLSGGTAGIGVQLFPDDPAAAEAIQAQVDLLPRAVLILGVDGSMSSTSFAANANVIVDPGATAGIPMDEQLERQRVGLEAFAEVHDARVVQLGGREVGRIRSTFGNDAFTYEVLSYLVDTGAELVVLTYSFGELDPAVERLADASAATFSAG